ncbi:unnamed protein product [Callosobruchus maculatus]|nr:unnamed protein product [Callosobruchus maculatus]
MADICIWSSLLQKHQIMSYALHQLPIYSMYYIHLLVILNFHFLVKLLISRVAFLSGLLQDPCRIRVYNFSVLTECIIGDQLQNFSDSQVIDDMVHLYDLMYEASLSLNNYYGIILLFALVGCLLHLLVTPFDLVLEIFHKHYSFIFLQTIWMFGHVLKLFLIVNPCEEISQEVENLSAMLIRRSWTDRRFDMNQLEIITMQIFHCRIRFTAAGLTEINRRIVTSIAAGVTTYLIILIQFNTTER